MTSHQQKRRDPIERACDFIIGLMLAIVLLCVLLFLAGIEWLGGKAKGASARLARRWLWGWG